MRQIIRIYIDNPQGVTDEEMAMLLRLTRSTVYRYRCLLDVVEIGQGRYTLIVDDEDVDVARSVLRRANGRI